MFREMSRARRDCVARPAIEGEACDPDDPTMVRFDRLLTKIPEHTWGEDTTWYLGDNDNWTNAQLHAVLSQPNYRMTIESWLDQRNYLRSALELLDEAGRPVYPALAQKVRANLAAAAPAVPELSGFVAVPGEPAVQAATEFVCRGWRLRFGLDAGLARLSRGIADPAATLDTTLGSYTYQTLDSGDFEKFDEDYGNGRCTPTSEDPGCHNFNKPNMTSAHPKHTETSPRLVQIWAEESQNGASGDQCAFHVQGSMPPHLHESYGAPETVWLSLRVVPLMSPEHPGTSSSVALHFDVQLFNKTATRLAEASWVTFRPDVAHPTTGWTLHGFRTGLTNRAADAGIDLARVVAHGATHLHSLGPFSTVDYRDAATNFSIASLDAPIVSAGLLSPFPTPGENTTVKANLQNGMHFNIQNNIWNVNFPQWYPFVDTDRNSRFRFHVEASL